MNIYITCLLRLFHRLFITLLGWFSFNDTLLDCIIGFLWIHCLSFFYTNHLLLWFFGSFFFGIKFTIFWCLVILFLILFTWFLLTVFGPGIFNFNDWIFLQTLFHSVKEIEVVFQVNFFLDFKMVLSDFIPPNVLLNYCSWIFFLFSDHHVHGTDPPSCFPTSLNHKHRFYFLANFFPGILLESMIPPVSLNSAGSVSNSHDLKLGRHFTTQLVKL